MVQSTRADLLALAAQTHEERLVDQISTRRAELLIAKHSPSHTLELLRKVEWSHRECQRLEQEMDTSVMQSFLCSGSVHVRGRTVGGSPVVWARTPRGSLHAHPEEAALYWIWIFRWALRIRPTAGHGVLICLDDRGRRPLDFSQRFLKLLASILQGANAAREPALVYFICSNSASSAIIRMFQRLVPSTVERDTVRFVAGPDELVSLLSDPKNIPDSFFTDRGIPFEPIPDFIGDFRSFLRRDGFKTMSVADWARPNSETVNTLLDCLRNSPYGGLEPLQHFVEQVNGSSLPRSSPRTCGRTSNVEEHTNMNISDSSLKQGLSANDPLLVIQEENDGDQSEDLTN